MKKTQLLTIAVLGLLLLNGGILWVLLRQPQHGPRPNHPPEMLKNWVIGTLDLDEKQIKAYEQLIREHHQQAVQLESRIKQYRKQSMLTCTDFDTVKEAHILNALAQAQLALQRTHIAHFQRLYRLCTPEQQALFTDMLRELPQHMPQGGQHPQGPGHGPGPGHEGPPPPP